MARIAGINIPNHQHADVALTAIYGIGHARAEAICKAAGVIGTRKMKDLSDAEVDYVLIGNNDLRNYAAFNFSKVTQNVMLPDPVQL